ncbi:MAG TPA: cytochrome c [Pyrinomonadaceae bacterium]|nr:cytochrome c [Pyrinomonadaceae bacterium]
MRKSISLPLIAFSLLLVVAILTVTSFDIAITSSAQNANSSVTTNKNSNQNDSRSIQSGGGGGQQQDFSKNTWELPEDADKTKNPVASSPESIEKGKALYLERTKGNCVFCHGETGTGNEANLAKLRRKPADITNKERMDKMTDGELFWKISKGITGIMPAGEKRMSEEERWHVVNYIRTLPKEKTP